MKHNSFILRIGTIITTVFSIVFTAPHLGDVFEFKQPDGSYVKVKIHGDEFYQRAEGLDGYTLVRNNTTGWIVYADLSANLEELIPTGIVYQHDRTVSKTLNPDFHFQKKLRISEESRQRKWQEAKDRLHPPLPEETIAGLAKSSAATAPAAPSGNLLGLTLLIDFDEDPATISREEVENFLNQPGYSGNSNNGSNFDYWHEVSGGKLEYTNYVSDYFRAPNSKSYYNQGPVGHDLVDELILQALQALNNDGFDFSTLSTTSGGRILAINILYSGSSKADWGVGLWPHSGSFRGYEADGVQSGRYQMTAMGSSLSLRTFCHENGHMIGGWPDLYDKNNPDSKGIGAYGLMASGGRDRRDPMMPNAYLRDRAGWDQVIDLTNALPGKYYHAANSNTSYLFRNPSNNKEFFFIESRIKSDKGRNGSIPDEGLLIWHIDEDGSNNNEQMTPDQHYRVSVEQADGQFHLEKDDNSGGDGDLFHAGHVNAFSDNSVPGSKWWDGQSSGLNIVNISAVGDSMSFELQEESITVVMVDGITGEDIGKFNGGRMTITDLPASINFRTIVSEQILSVTYSLSGDQIHNATLDYEPFLFFPSGWTPAEGAYTLSVTGYAGAGGSGEQLAQRNIDFILSTEVIAGYFVDTELNTKDIEIENNGVYNLNSLPENLGISAEPTMAVGSISFRMSGQQSYTQTESIYPYALFSDDGAGDFSAWDPGPEEGTYTLEINAHSQSGGGGQVVATRNITFSLTRGPVNVVDDKSVVHDIFQLRQLPSGHLEFIVKEPVNLTIRFIRLDGRGKYHINRYFSRGAHRLDLPASFRMGVYFVKIGNGNGKTAGKIVRM